MTNYEEQARELLEQCRKDNAAHHIGLFRHQIWMVAKLLRERKALLDAAQELIRHADMGGPHGFVSTSHRDKLRSAIRLAKGKTDDN